MRKTIKETLGFKDLSAEEKKQRGILGRLYGPCADITGPTRNGRKYSDELWTNVFNKNDIVKELLDNGGIPGEAQHPADRSEIDTEKIAIMMPEAPKKDDKGHLIAYWDILDTPCGRILYQLAKYGFKLGISSRGTGDVMEDVDGNESVDPETYDFTCFDAVIVPSVKDARLTMVESLSPTKQKGFRKALSESLESATEDDRKIMEEALDEMNIKLVEEKSEVVNDKEEDEERAEAPVPDEVKKEIESDEPVEVEDEEVKGVEELQQDENTEESEAYTVGDLQDELKDYAKELAVEFEPLEIDGKEYQIKMLGFDDGEEGKVVISIGYDQEIGDNIEDETDEDEFVVIESKEASDTGTNEIVDSLKEALSSKNELEAKVLTLQEKLAVSDTKAEKLTEEIEKYKRLSSRLSTLAKDSKSLQESISNLESQVESKEKIIKAQQARIESLVISSRVENGKAGKLTESLSGKDSEIKSLNEKISDGESKLEALTEQLESVRQDSEIKHSEYMKKIAKANKIIESYKNVAKETLTRYIESKANMLGVKPVEIENRLNESYTIDDIDSVCEDLQSYNVRMSRLPFNVGRKTRITVTESKNDLVTKNTDDTVDDDLYRLGGL